MRFVIYQDNGGQFHWHPLARARDADPLDSRFRHRAHGMAVTRRDQLRPHGGRPWM